jgi:hypothetical protein
MPHLVSHPVAPYRKGDFSGEYLQASILVRYGRIVAADYVTTSVTVVTCDTAPAVAVTVMV